MTQLPRKTEGLIPLEQIYQAKTRLKDVALLTPLMHHLALSEKYDCNLYLKREDLQVVRSYKIRGAYNKLATLQLEDRQKGIVCASAGNHAQGVALACRKLSIKGQIYMPETTPRQKIEKVRFFGKDWVDILLRGDTFDDAYQEAQQFAQEHGQTFVHPFDDEQVIAGQGSLGLEIVNDCDKEIDILMVPIGGGGLAAGLGSLFRQISPQTKIIGVEPQGAPAMYQSLQAQKVVALEQIDPFVDGAAVKRVGEKNFAICRQVLEEVLLVPEGKVCSTILELYNQEAIVVEPAGALTIAALDDYRQQIKGKNVVCVVSGGNNDVTRTEEIKERSLLHQGLKHYFIIRFPQRAGALRAFLNNVLGPKDDITHFEYTKKNSRLAGPALVGLELANAEDYSALIQRMEGHQIRYQTLNDNPMLFDLVV